MIRQWEKWLDDNPDADRHQRYYASGVIDGLRYAVDPTEPFIPLWLESHSHDRRLSMPTATSELRAKMDEYFGNEIDDSGPRAFLLGNGWIENRGVWSSPPKPTEKEWDCLDFLVQEWDYAYSAGKQETA